MNRVLTAIAGGALLCCQAASAQAQMGALFYNGLPDTIVAAEAAWAEQCDKFICGEWVREAKLGVVPLATHQAAAAFRLPSAADAENRVCRWNLKIVTLPQGQASQEHVFEAVDFCTADPVVISLGRAEFGVFATYGYQDPQGRPRWVVIPAEPVEQTQ